MEMCTAPNLVVMIILVMVGLGGCSIQYSAGAAAPYVSRQVVLEVFSAFKAGIRTQEALASWDTSNQSSNPCTGDWAGLLCDYGIASDNTTVIITNILIDLKNKSLQGFISPQLARLSGTLVSLDLSYNSLSGTFTLLSNFSSSDDPLQSLTLDYNRLQGPFTLPPSCFPRLQFLSIAMNSFSGRLPSEAVSHCPSLQLFNVSNNNFTGPLFPAGLGNLSNTLMALDAGINHLSGPIPPSIGNCSKLTFLSLPWNNFSGPFPSSIGLGCPNLTFLSLFDNKLSGILPSEIGLLSRLAVLSIGFNTFSGDIFRTLTNCSALSTVDTTNNSFTGQMPVDVGSRLPHLQFLNMEFNMLSGSIPESLGNCSNLMNLILGFSYRISGIIPAALFRARNIIHLDLQFNSLRGRIPPEIGNLTAVQTAFLNNNQFTGSLPEELGMLASIQTLTLGSNSLSGNFPNQLFNCTTLTGLGVHDNSLGGSISSSIGRLINLGSVDASNNQLIGHIPLGLSNCTSMASISLANNMLSGEIPSAVIARLVMCSAFNFSHNDLSGPIPDGEAFAMKIHLETLDLSHNNLSGAVPTGLAACVALASLDLSRNKLAGPFPSALGTSLGNLVNLNLSHNFINGSIPTELPGFNESLQRLDLSSNSLSGTIPSALARLESLQFLNLSYNSQLEGPIPTGGVFRNLTSTSFLGDPFLCGAAINTTCNTRRRRHSAIFSSMVNSISIAVAAVLLLIILIVLIAFALRRRRGTMRSKWNFSPFVRLTLEDIQEATGNFSEDNVLGTGVTGTVYKGILKDGTPLAFKKFKLDDHALGSFITELESVGKIRHRNLVKIMGYYSNLDTSILILEYLPNGSLEDHLHGEDAAVLSWDARLRVAMDVSHGLLYLHHDCPAPVIHCDLKPQNILLDGNLEVRITDFGLAKVMVSAATSNFTENMKGTLGYMAPELASCGHISRKCDLYSYGILLMELITGRRPSEEVQMSMQAQQLEPAGDQEDAQGTKTSLVQWVASMLEAGDMNKIMDKRLLEAMRSDTDIIRGDENVDDQMRRILKLAVQCTHENPTRRPTMQHVVQALTSITSTHDNVQVNSKVLGELLSPDTKAMQKSCGQDSI